MFLEFADIVSQLTVTGVPSISPSGRYPSFYFRSTRWSYCSDLRITIAVGKQRKSDSYSTVSEPKAVGRRTALVRVADT